MTRIRYFAGMLAWCVLATIVAAAPASADPPATIKLGSHETGVPEDCARVGDAAPMNPKWDRVDYDYDPMQEELGEVNAFSCADSILDFLVDFVQNHLPTNQNSSLHIQLRAALYSGSLDLTSPYETFLNNIYLTVPVLAALSPIPEEPADEPSGLATCILTSNYLLVHCKDDMNGSVVLRDQDGYPLLDQNEVPITLPISGILTSLGGGTTYGSVFLQSPDHHEPLEDKRLEHHEQVHAQQWAKWGWNFGSMYIAEDATEIPDQIYHHLMYGLYGGTVLVPADCFNPHAGYFEDAIGNRSRFLREFDVVAP